MPLLYTQRGFRKAIAKGDTALVARYLERDITRQWLDVSLDDQSNSSLNIAAGSGRKAVIEQLLDAGANIEHPNASGVTPLGTAVLGHSKNAMELLIEKGANLEAAMPSGSLLMTAINNYFEEGALILLKSKPELASGEALRAAVERGFETLTVKLLEAGALEEADAKDPPLLHVAASNNNIPIAQALLRHGADIDEQDIRGNTALHQAAENYWHTDMISFLLENGGRPDTQNNAGKTPLGIAQRNGASDASGLLARATDRLIAKNATPLTAEAQHMPDESAEEWVMMGDTQVARVGLYPATGRRLTHIFNFESRERIIISENLKTGAENITQPEKFDTLEEAHVSAALEAYRKLGGEAEDADVFGARMTKKQIPGPGGQ